MKKALFVAVFLALLVGSSPVSAQTLTPTEREALIADLREQLLALMNQLVARLQADMIANTEKMIDLENKQAEQDQRIKTITDNQVLGSSNQEPTVSLSDQKKAIRKQYGYNFTVNGDIADDPEVMRKKLMENGKYVSIVTIAEYFDGETVEIVAKDRDTGQTIEGEIYEGERCWKIVASDTLRLCGYHMKYLLNPGQFMEVVGTTSEGDTDDAIGIGRKISN